MRPFLFILLVGAGALSFFSCATASREPVPSGEVKLLKMNVPEADSIRTNSPFTTYIQFESEGKPEIKDVCFTWSGEGPYCFKVAELYPGTPQTLKVEPRVANPGSFAADCFVLYAKGGIIRKTNTISTRLRVSPK